LKESIPILETFESKVQRNVESFDGFGQKLESESAIFPELNSTYSNQKIKTYEYVKDPKNDGKSKPRTPKQIDSYGRNFRKGRSTALKVQELDSRLRNLQSFVLSMISGFFFFLIISGVIQQDSRVHLVTNILFDFYFSKRILG
jgi:hypothetical protein